MATKEQEKKLTLEQFIQKAEQRKQDKKLGSTITAYVPSLDAEMEFRSLTDAEIREVMGTDDESDDRNKSDKVTVYKASVGEASFRELAKVLMDKGEIREYMEVMDILPLREVLQLSKIIMETSGVIGGEKVNVVKTQVNAIKN